MLLKNLLLLFLALTVISCGSSDKKPGETVLAGNNKEVVCFVYHRFGDDRYSSTNVSIKDFRAHLQYLKGNDFQVLSFADAIDYLNSGATEKKTAVITVDDGYKSFYKNGLPVLKEFGFPATLFINTKTVGSNGYMGWDELKAAKNSNIEIGNHTHSHDYFLNLPANSRYETFRNELEQSQHIIREMLDFEPETFAYPFGEYDETMKNIVADMGFKAAAAQFSGVIYAGTDLMLCPRFPMSESYADLGKFASKANMHALRVAEKSPKNPILPAGKKQPELTLQIENTELQMGQLQCFIQGSDCEIISKEKGKIRIKPAGDISARRRTLYTITVPHKNGKWHWFSHLWINPNVSGGQ